MTRRLLFRAGLKTRGASFNQFMTFACKTLGSAKSYSPAASQVDGRREGVPIGAPNNCCSRRRISEFYVEVSEMHLVITAALVIGFMALLIGFLSVAHDLLSRFTGESCSHSNEARSEPIDRERGHPQLSD